MAASRPRVHSIFKVKANGRTRLIVFDTQDLWLGRSPENDIAVDDPEMSRKHAVFRRTPQGVRVEDQGTSNGTGVNGEAVAHAQLKHGDVIQVGEVEITYAETAKNPASLGGAVEYASQLKSFASPLAGTAGATGGEATILGVLETPGGDTDDEPFEVRPAGEFDFGLLDQPAPKSAPRNLDAELADLGSDPGADLDFAFDTAPPRKAPPAAAAPTAAAPQRRAASARQAAPAPSEAWVLEDAPEGAAPGPLAITLEIEGLEGELRRNVEALVGKVLRVPGLRIRVKGRDLG